MSIFFSIIIPTYNRANFIRNTIESILFQDYENYELIVVDDCSSDEHRLEEKLKQYDFPITLVRLEKRAPSCQLVASARCTCQITSVFDVRFTFF